MVYVTILHISLHCANPITNMKYIDPNFSKSLANIRYIIMTNGPVSLKPLKGIKDNVSKISDLNRETLFFEWQLGYINK